MTDDVEGKTIFRSRRKIIKPGYRPILPYPGLLEGAKTFPFGYFVDRSKVNSFQTQSCA